jgi:hypothetical protein
VSVEAELREEFDRWERKASAVLMVLPYPLLAVSVVFTLLQPLWDAPVHFPAVLGFSAVLTAWVAWFHTAHPEWHDHDRLMGLYYAGLVAITACLVLLTPWFGFFAFIGYVHAFQYLRSRWRYVGVAVTSAVSAISYVGGAGSITAEKWWEWPAVSALTTVIATAAFYADVMSDRRNHRQKRALTELHRANTELGTALAEADEIDHWFWMAAQLRLGDSQKLAALGEEAKQLRAMLAESVRAARRTLQRDLETRHER